jgi:hypothetical protein
MNSIDGASETALGMTSTGSYFETDQTKAATHAPFFAPFSTSGSGAAAQCPGIFHDRRKIARRLPASA